jgi:hypothetical protein
MKALPERGLVVVEFWATWCVPCRETIPKLSLLAKQNPDIQVIGVGIWEEDDGKNIRSFVDRMGSKMDFRVGYSGNQDGMAASWMEASVSGSIPTAFLVRDRQVVWIGHPAQLEPVITAVRAGTWDVSAARSAHQTRSKATQQLTRVAALGGKLGALYQEEGAAATIAEVRRRRAEFDAIPDVMDDLEITYLSEVDWDAWASLVRKSLLKGREETRVSIVDAAWRHLNEPKMRAHALRILEFGFSEAGPKDFVYTFTAARAYEHAKLPQDAIRMLDLASNAIPPGEFEAALRKRIADMRTRLQKAISG